MRHWKIILSLVAIFVAGCITGGVLTVAITKRVAARRSAGTAGSNFGAVVVQHYQKQLELTPEQVEKLKPVFARAAAGLRNSRSNLLTEVTLAMRQMNEDIARELTPEQQARFEKMKERNRARLKNQFNAILPAPDRRPQKSQ